jgi:hypothetical protein
MLGYRLRALASHGQIVNQPIPVVDSEEPYPCCLEWSNLVASASILALETLLARPLATAMPSLLQRCHSKRPDALCRTTTSSSALADNCFIGRNYSRTVLPLSVRCPTCKPN